MENYYLMLLIFGISTALLIFRKNFVFHRHFIFFFCLCRTKFGILQIEKFTRKHSRLLKKTALFSIIIAFLGMFLVSLDLGRMLYRLFQGTIHTSVGFVLPLKAKGVFYVPIMYWLISVFFIVIVHEFAHGVFLKLYNLKIKSTGFAFLGAIIPLIPAAFVEPDEKQLAKAEKHQQLAVLSAGSFSNIFFGIFFLLIFLSLTPATNSFFSDSGVQITGFFNQDTPAKNIGMLKSETITKIDTTTITNEKDFSNFFQTKNAGDKISIITNKRVYFITLAENPKLGIFVKTLKEKTSNSFFVNIFLWFYNLFYWLFLLNLGVGLFNLLPLGPLDGGRMIKIVLQQVLPDRTAQKIWIFLSFFILSTVITSILVGLTL